MSHGEWRYEKGYVDFFGDASDTIFCGDMVLAEVYGTEADGQLMATAPKLLAVCKALLAWGMDDKAGLLDLLKNVVAPAEAAVDEAEGVRA